MTELHRQEVAATAETIITNHTELETKINEILESGRRVVLVSSGAVGAGMHRLELTTRPQDLSKLQAVAALGQSALIEAYDQTLQQFGRHAAQVLLTADGLDNRASYLNVRNTILTLLEYGAVPIINENDTVAVDELMTTFGDNDRLAALVTNLLRAPLLIMLSDVDGLYQGDPEVPKSHLISTVTKFDESLFQLVQDQSSGVGKGGMASKLEAANLVTMAGENMVIANGHDVGVLKRILQGDNVGTLFVAQGKSISPWKRWIGLAVQPRGRLLLDPGACRAIVSDGRSLLAIGVVAAEGDFSKGDVVSLCNDQTQELARGLINYGRRDIDQIRGLKSTQIAEVLGQLPYEEIIHRDNMVVLSEV